MAIDTPCSLAAKCSDDLIGTEAHDNPVDPPEDVVPGIGHSEFVPHAEDWYRDPGSGKLTPDGRRRRRAKQACWSDCPSRMRLLCLDAALQQGPGEQFGIWGGYDEGERDLILLEIARREDIRDQAQEVIDTKSIKA